MDNPERAWSAIVRRQNCSLTGSLRFPRRVFMGISRRVRLCLREMLPGPARWGSLHGYRWRTCSDVYHRPYDAKRPLVCLDEASKQLIGDDRQPLPARPGSPAEDYEYVRNGTANLFMVSEPLAGWRRWR